MSTDDCTCCDDQLVKTLRWLLTRARTRRYSPGLQQIIWMEAGGGRPSAGDGQFRLLDGSLLRVYAEETLQLLSASSIEPGPAGQLQRVLQAGDVAIGVAIATQPDGFFQIGGVQQFHRAAPGVWEQAAHFSGLDFDDLLPEGLVGASPLDIAGTPHDFYVLWAGLAALDIGSYTQYLVSRHNAALELQWLTPIHTPPEMFFGPGESTTAITGCLSLGVGGVYATVRQRFLFLTAGGSISFDTPLDADPMSLTYSGDYVYITVIEPEADPSPPQFLSVRLYDLSGGLLAWRQIPDLISPQVMFSNAAGSDSTLWLTGALTP
jgi:hypothetical protein